MIDEGYSLCRRTHAIERLMDRHAILATVADYNDACKQIRERKAEYVAKTSKVTGVFFVMIQGKRVPCIYATDTDNIVTFCNNKWVKRLRKKHPKGNKKWI